MALGTTRTKLGPQFSEGARLLWVAMKDHGRTQGALGKFLGTQPGVVSRWLYGDVRPGLDWAGKLRDTLGIPFEAWSAPPAKRFTPPAARRAA